ncbi:MAG TPA: condensation domain-containing protein [Blastocatellia bacterium]|nr:condensation domain-containing protein [Blastocatellia bacterium]
MTGTSAGFLPPGILDARLKAEKDYWLEKMSGARSALAMPVDFRRSAGQRASVKRIDLDLDDSAKAKILGICNGKAELSLAALAAALKVCLRKWSGLEDITLCTTIHEQYGELAALNRVLALRDRVDDSATLLELMHDVKRTLFGAYANQKYPFDRLLDLVGLARPDARVPLTNVAILMRNINNRENLSHLRFDATFLFSVDGGDLSGSMEYDARLFRRGTVEMLAAHFSEVITMIALRNDKKVGEVQLSSPSTDDRFSHELPLRSLIFGGPASGYPARDHGALAEGACEVPPLARNSHRRYFPLTLEQQRLWSLDHKDPGSPADGIFALLNITGKLDPKVVEESVNEMAGRHEILRTTFATSEERVIQVVAPRSRVKLSFVDLSALEQGEREREASRLASEMAHSRFDLGRGPLLKLALARLTGTDHRLLLSAHGIIFDRASISAFARELTALYGAISEGSPLPTAPTFQFGDFALWQRKRLQERVSEERPENEQGKMGPGPSGPSRGARASRVTMSVAAEVKQALEQLGRGEGVTLFTVLLAGFSTLLYRHHAEGEITVAVPNPNRELFETEGMIGPLATQLLVRTKVSGDTSFRHLLSRVSEAVSEAYANRDLPVEALIQKSNGGGRTKERLFPQAVFSFSPTAREKFELPSLTIDVAEVLNGTRESNFFMDMQETGEGLAASITYDGETFEPRTIEIMTAHFKAMLSDAAARPDTRLIDLSLDGNVEAGAADSAPGFQPTDEVEQFDFQF